MLLLVSGATGYPRDAAVGHLIVPGQWNRITSLDLQPGRVAFDNGCFKGLDEGAFVRMLERFSGLGGRTKGNGCDGTTPAGVLFAAAPDKVGDAAWTLERWPFWSRLIRGVGFPPAFVAQDGIRVEDVPWDELGALFIGGYDRFKDGDEARTLIGYAKARGVWVHVGRVNGQRRYNRMKDYGADSIDGSGFSMYPDVNIPKAAEWEAARAQRAPLLA